jgi:hypothetical protein
MTTLCTLFGLLPLALGLGAGAELQKPLALAVIGGLSLSTLVTLVLGPVGLPGACEAACVDRRLVPIEPGHFGTASDGHVSSVERPRGYGLPLLAVWIFRAESHPPRHTRIFGAYSVNADYVENVPFAIVVDQPVSPFFSLGSGPYGFEASIERGAARAPRRESQRIRVFRSVSWNGSWCQPPSICAVSLAFEDDASAMYFNGRSSDHRARNKRTSLFAHVMAGAVHSSSTFRLMGRMSST